MPDPKDPMTGQLPLIKPVTRLWRVEGNHFVAGVLTEDERITHTAPILRHLLGYPVIDLMDMAARRGWTVEQVGSDH